MKACCSRRKFLSAAGVAVGAYIAQPRQFLARPTPAGRVAVSVCSEYSPQVVDVLSTMFDQLGGLEGLVRGKTVAIKLNLTGGAADRFHGVPPEMTHWVHPQVVWATVHLLGKAGARRIRLLESAAGTAEPLPEFMMQAGWKPGEFLNAASRVEFENTNYLGSGKNYVRFWVPGGGLTYKGYDLNHSYRDCDVFVSLAKMKEHTAAGVTLSMKNNFGITPCTIYGSDAPKDEPGLFPHGGRGFFHYGNRLPPKSAPQPVHPNGPKDSGYIVPRVVADLVAARPVHLAVIDGIYSMSGGELPDYEGVQRLHPGLLVAGRNCVCTDAVAVALMGFDPMAERGTPPFQTCDNSLELAEHLGVGTRDLKRIEVVGTPIFKARYPFPPLRHGIA
jgi:uncharacterized protein (DUF362 family)